MDEVMVKRVLMIAYHFPPLQGSSGIQRTLKFSRYLPECGWEPVVLTAHERAYESVSPDQLGDVSPRAIVKRAFALDTARHLSVFKRYPRLLSLPDRWISWLLGAVPAGLGLIRRYRPQVIWSTYPIATAHLIGWFLHRLTGIPWIADMRDPMTDADYPSDNSTRKVFQWIENLTIRNADCVVCTTPGAIDDYRQRFPQIPATRFRLIENGYDEEVFSSAKPSPAAPDGKLTLLHSGIVYPSERDPGPLFAALSEMRAEDAIDSSWFRLRLRATGHDDHLRALLKEQGIEDLVELAPSISYREALAEMLSVDGLLILQAANCNRQVPAKLYEYLRARRPILALTDLAGDTATTLRHAGIDSIAPLDDKNEIRQALGRFIRLVKTGDAPRLSEEAIRGYSRRARTQELASVLNAYCWADEQPRWIELNDEKTLP
jgi:hypothetical protein